MSTAGNYDVIVIGGGHNGLVTAAYLAKAGRRVLVLERRHILGGAACTEELFPGIRLSPAAYLNGLFRREIIDDLGLAGQGLTMLQRNPSSFSPFPDGRSLLMGPDMAWTQREIAKFSARDADAIVRWEHHFDRMTALLEPVIMGIPPSGAEGIAVWDRVGELVKGLSARDGADVLEVLTGSATDMLDRYFESDEVKATLATDGVIGTFAGPSAPGTAYVLFHHVMGETFGVRGVWSYVRGGMGAISAALAAVAKAHGADIRTDCPVARILTRDGAATGVALADGREFHAPVVAANVGAAHVFLRMLDPRQLPDEFVTAVRRIDYRSASLKINAVLDRLPDFKCLPSPADGSPGPQHRGTFHVSPTMAYIERAYDDAKYGRPSTEPIIEGALPTVLDDTLAPAGKHVLSLFIQYAPYAPADGPWDQPARDRFADRVFAVLEQYAPGITRSVLHRRVYTPPDIEEVFGLTGGNIFQGAVNIRQFWASRPVPGYGGYATPVRGLYLCGSAAHPGGGVTGIPGRNAAAVILRNAR